MQSRDFTLELGNGGINYHTPNDMAGWRITFADTGMDALKGARVRKASHYTTAPRFFVTYADGVANIDLPDLLEFHKRQGSLATITGVRAYSRFGVMETDSQGHVKGFQEKPLLDTSINGGFMVFEREILSYLHGGDDVDLEGEPFHQLAADGQLAVYQHSGFWRAMDTFKEAQELNTLWEHDAPWKIW